MSIITYLIILLVVSLVSGYIVFCEKRYRWLKNRVTKSEENVVILSKNQNTLQSTQAGLLSKLTLYEKKAQRAQKIERLSRFGRPVDGKD